MDHLRELPFPDAPSATHFLCLVRYDYPEDRPGSLFPASLELEPQRRTIEAVAPPAADRASGRELKGVLAALWRQAGPGLARHFVPRPAPGADSRDDAHPLRFVFASCQYPAGMVDRQQALQSYRLIADHFAGRPPERVLLLGDQVYTDATYGMLDPTRIDDRYRVPYEQLNAPDGPLAQLPQDLRRVLRMTPDDHEFINDWEPWRPGARGERYERGLAGYWRHQRGENDPQGLDVWIKEAAPAQATQRWHLFMADSRTQREHRDERSVATASLLGTKQTGELEEWLRSSPREDLKIVTSPAMLLPRARMHVDEPLRLENWQGYPASFHRLLAFLCDEQVANVVFLSGDAHLGCRARVQVRNRASGQRTVFESHHAPALYAPYPFANETRWNLLRRDRFGFAWGGRSYECRVAAVTLREGVNGCGVLEARRAGAQWKLQTRFLAARA